MARRTLSGAYSERKIAVATPTGIATMAAIPATSRVPAARGRTPYDWGLSIGDHRAPRRKSQMGISMKNPHAWESRLTTMPIVVKMDTMAHAKKIVLTTWPSMSRRGRLGPDARLVPVFPTGPEVAMLPSTCLSFEVLYVSLGLSGNSVFRDCRSTLCTRYLLFISSALVYAEASSGMYPTSRVSARPCSM